MLPRLSPLLRTSTFPTSMARVIPRAAAAPLSHTPNAVAFVRLPSARLGFVANANRFGFVSQSLKPSISNGQGLSPLRGRVWASQREYRKVRRRAAKSKEKELELNVSICIEEDLPDDPEVLSIAEMLRLNVPMAMKLAFDGLKDSTYKTRDTAINDVGGFESVELSVLLCNDEFIRELNKEWRDEDHATDVLSMSEHVPELKLPILMLGDIVISVETAARQAEERGHTLLDEIRILMVHGLLHLLGFDHELSEEAEAEMEKEEELLLKSLGWKGKGLIQSAYDAENSAYSHKENTDVGFSKDRKKEGSLRFYKPKFKYIFCDMDGTLLNSKSQVTPANAKALKEAMSRGVKVVIATGKARPAVIESLKMVDLAGKDGIVSEFSPGVFLQLMLGDIVISVETAARQAEERGHTLLDEIRILMVHGLLHLLGFDHELSEEAEAEMEKEEELLLKSLGWKGKGLIQSAYDAENSAYSHKENTDVGFSKDRKKEGSLRFYKPKFKYIFCDMDGTLLNSKSQVTPANARALKEAMSRGVKVVIATGKARPAVIESLKMVDLAGKDGIVSEFSPGVFLQGLIVYGRQGREIFRRNLDPDVCRETYLYSWENKVPLVAFTKDRCLTLFDHPLVDSMHTIYHESKAEVIPSVESLLAAAEIQKVIFIDTAEGVSTTLRPYWLNYNNVSRSNPKCTKLVDVQIMAIGDGENDIEMLELAMLGIALSNGSEKTKAVANAIGVSNDEDGVADAIYRYAF
ncbi:endoribonuclease ybey [Quercus suber]|uniref:Endoribonuclease ybey n=1 Tax=Quercus suber TaxID=58331 RepID=A0AAW0J731_QUESU